MGEKRLMKRPAALDTMPKKERASGWVRSTSTAGDLKKLKKSRPSIAGGIFFDFILHGLALPAHEFLRGLLFVYGVQLHQLTPNSILRIACFITLCECKVTGKVPYFIEVVSVKELCQGLIS
jgi:hypothetical protein